MHRINYLWLLFVFLTIYFRIETCLADNGKHVTYANSSLSESTLFCLGLIGSRSRDLDLPRR